MEFDRENPSPLTRLPGGAETQWHDWSPELETAYLQQLAGVENLESATSLQLVVNTAAGGSIAHLGPTLTNLLELNLNGSTLDSLRDLGTGFRQLQVLWVSRCGLKALDGLNGLPALRELYAAYNDIVDLQPVDSCQHLEVLDVECNCIPDADAVLYLVSCAHLQVLTLAGNPAAEQPDYRRAVCTTLLSLQVLDEEPVTPADRKAGAQQHGAQRTELLQRQADSCNAGVAGSNSSASTITDGTQAALQPQPPVKAAAAAAVIALPGGRVAGIDSGAAGVVDRTQPDADEVAFVIAGIKHARVGVDSHEFREIEMNLLVATADGTDVQLDVRPGTSTLLPASTGTWVRTLRSSREGNLAALRATHLAAAAAATSTARTGSQSPTSACSGSPIGSRPPSSSQQQRTSALSASPPSHERWAVATSAGATLGLSSSFGAAASIPPTAAGPPGTWRPSSGAGIGLLGGGGGNTGGVGAPIDSPRRPGSGDFRPGSGRPFSARPGTAASFSARLGTSASTGTTSAVATAGLYWAKNRISGGSGGASGAGRGAEGASASRAVTGNEDGVAGSSKLTQGTDSTFGGSFARDLRKWKGAAVRAAASTSSGGGGAAGGGAAGGASGEAAVPTAAALGGRNGLSQTLLRSGQLDPKALLEELKRWKLETADKVLFVDPDDMASGDTGWAGSDGPEGLGGSDALLSNGETGGGGHRADILRLSTSQDGSTPDTGPLGIALEVGLALLDAQGPEPVFSPAIPVSPLPPPRPPAGAAAAGRRKMVLAKVLRDIAADNIDGTGACISEILAGLRPVHAPPAYSGGVDYQGPSVAWGPPAADAAERTGGSGAVPVSGSSLTQGNPTLRHQSGQGSAHRPGSAKSVCSSSGHSDYGASVAGQSGSRPASRDEPGVVASGGSGGWVSGAFGGGGVSSGGAGAGAGGASALQRQKSATRAPGLPVGPSAPATTYRVASVAGEMDVRSSNPSPAARLGNW